MWGLECQFGASCTPELRRDGVYPDDLAPLEVQEPRVQKSGVEVSRGERGAPFPSVIPQNCADPIGHQFINNFRAISATIAKKGSRDC